MARIAAKPHPQQAGRPSRVPCAADPERMFPLEESTRASQDPTAGERAALRVCSGCPVLARCREQVLEQPLPYGVVGGLTAAQRRTVRARRAGHAGERRPGVAA